MKKKAKTKAEKGPSLEAVLKEMYRPDGNTRVSKLSRYSDGTWYFTDSSQIRLNSVPKTRLMIPWKAYETGELAGEKTSHLSAVLPQTMLQELKVLAYLNLKLPTAFPRTGKQSVKPQTVVTTIRALVTLLSEIQEEYVVEMNAAHVNRSPIQSIADIPLADIKHALSLSARSDGAALSKGLADLASPIMKNVFAGGALQWNPQDLKTLEFHYPQPRTDYEKAMPNDLFRLLSNTACNDVTTFLRFLGESLCDPTTHPDRDHPLSSIADGKKAMLDYIEIRKSDRIASAKAGSKQSATGILRRAFKRNHRVTPQEFQLYLYRVQRAAYCVIGLYTGGRYSDLTSFKTGCVAFLHGQHVLAGTTAKNRALGAPEGKDLWPAILIMRDAIRCLEEISKVTFNPYLISGCFTVAIGTAASPLTLTGFASAINAYLHLVDTSGRWKKWHINPHQLRHTLARQLSRADVGLLYIAHQMKHLHTALSALPPDVTSQYGNIGGLTQQRAMESRSAHEEAARALYGSNQPIAGGGAEDFKQRRKAYFSGMAAQGWTEDEVIGHLAKQGLPFASVGLAYCGGKREILLKDGTKELPPCLGALQCAPGDCKQAVVTKVHEPLWRKIATHNKSMANDPRMLHAKAVFEAAATKAERVLLDLAVTVEGGHS
ncbi:hypothetical protein os4_22950 [Comamonadaceae bacterium OS-4]|nr:hypothetical protein os4_22950 [Comamonadaceae bacterium OS-4]